MTHTYARVGRVRTGEEWIELRDGSSILGEIFLEDYDGWLASALNGYNPSNPAVREWRAVQDVVINPGGLAALRDGWWVLTAEDLCVFWTYSDPSDLLVRINNYPTDPVI